MINVNETPNHVHANGDSAYTKFFGPLHSVTAVNLAGEHHRPHVTARFDGGVRLELDVTTASHLARELPGALLKIGIVPECSGIASEVEL